MAGSQMSITALSDPNYDLNIALNEWQLITDSTNSLGSSLRTPDSTQAISKESSATPESSQSTNGSNTFAAGNEFICYGMVSDAMAQPKAMYGTDRLQLHRVDVQLVGCMQQINSKLRTMDSQYTYFTLHDKGGNVILRFKNVAMDFGYLRSGVCRALAPLLPNPHVTLEALALRGSLMDIIGRANKSVEAMVKVDVNVYGYHQAMTEVGNKLSEGKMWLQTPDCSTPGIPHRNPHFFPVKLHGVPMEAMQAPDPAADRTKTRRREDQLRKMVQEVYKSVDNNRHLERVDGGDRVTQTLLQ